MTSMVRNSDIIVVDLVSGDTPWWQVASALGPFAVLLAAFIAAYYARKNILHRRESEQRSEWWTRAQWAFDSTNANEPVRQQQGLAVLDILAGSNLAGPEEVRVIETAWEAILGSGSMDGELGMGDNGSAETRREEGKDELD